MQQYKAVLKDFTGAAVTHVKGFYYASGGHIYAMCKKGGFVICPEGLTRSSVNRFNDFLIWKMDLTSRKEDKNRLIAKLRANHSMREIQDRGLTCGPCYF